MKCRIIISCNVKRSNVFYTFNKKINIIDATFGGGGYSKAILENFNVEN